MFDCHLAVNVYPPMIGKHLLEVLLILRNRCQNKAMSHDGYRGVYIRLKYDLISDQYTLLCDTYTNGSVEFCLMINSTRLTLAFPKDRFSIPFDGIPTFVRSACLKKLQQSGRGSLIAYRYSVPSLHSQEWQIDIAHSIWHNQPNKFNHIELWKFLVIQMEFLLC